MADGDAVSSTLSALKSECATCGEWSTFTGRTEERDGRTLAVVRCPNRDGEFPVWRRDREPLVAAYVAARARLRDVASYDRALAVLIGRDSQAISALLAAPPAEMPLFSIQDVAVSAKDASRWCELVLSYEGWQPRPDPATRVEEVLATAIAYDAPMCAAVLVDRVGLDEVRRLLPVIERRFPNRKPEIATRILAVLDRVN